MNRSCKFLQIIVTGMVFTATLFISVNGLAQRAQTDIDSEREFNERDLQQRSWNLRMLSIMANQKRPQNFNPQKPWLRFNKTSRGSRRLISRSA